MPDLSLLVLEWNGAGASCTLFVKLPSQRGNIPDVHFLHVGYLLFKQPDLFILTGHRYRCLPLQVQ